MTKLSLEANPIVEKYGLLKGLTLTDAQISYKNIFFRGHGENHWALEPTLFRTIDKSNVHGADWLHHHKAEFNILNDFQNSCDLTGVYLPSDNNSLRVQQKKIYEEFFDMFNFDGLEWFTEEFFELAAFGQHYGIPTRLLDWSKNPFVACYFASSHALSLNDIEDKNLCIWVLNTEKLPFDISKVLNVLDLPKGVNQHIAHQQGVLSYLNFDRKIYNKLGVAPALNLVMDYFNESHRLLKINISSNLASDIFHYCDSHSINACNLFRGAHGAAIHTKDLIKLKKR
ncbi:FRG domain-containing protein [Acinetobacter baumannii]|uniref:FRG domain-containing protein n=1 Tax=Acinetobacter baumannii TaxID=470 RepID=UPI003F6180DC